jgi:hypothetical protein
MTCYAYRKFLSLFLIIFAAGCGGGSTHDTTTLPADPVVTIPSEDVISPPVDTNPPLVSVPAPVFAPMTMSCIDGPTYQCSGGSIIRSDNGVALTSSGVQVYGKSTSDLANPIEVKTTAYGLALASGGVAEIRLAKDNNGIISEPALLLNNLGLSWDGKIDRPQIVETFRTSTQGRVQLDASGALAFSALPSSSDLGFYDFATKRTEGTQLNYANNRYFPRDTPSRCGPGMTPCRSTEEASAFQYRSGDWRTGGDIPDTASVARLHGDGDVHAGNGTAGNGTPDANGVFILPGGDGIGVPFPGSKGYRSFHNRSFQYGNLSTWVTQDTVQIAEWTAGAGTDEHNKNRRGIVAFGAVSDPAGIPANGTATYSGIAYGWYYAPDAADTTKDPSSFRGETIVTVNFATRQVVVAIRNTVSDGSAIPVPVALEAVTAMGAMGTNVANYLTGPVNNGTLKGGLSGRYFGPVVATGTSGKGPTEVGGAFSLSNSTTGRVAVGGFIARKR